MSPVTADELRELGLDVVWVGEWPSDPGDPAILARAHAEGRIVITLDKDYGELAVVHRQAHAGIIRFTGIPSRDHAATIVSTTERYGGALEIGAIVTVSPQRTRVRLDDGDPA
jgi:predicted nuclease of predicted toxin-antitoxin system